MANEHLTIFPKNSQEYKNLQQLMWDLNAHSDLIQYTIETTYFDVGQNWKYTTLIAHNPNESGILSSWQALNPKQQKLAVYGSDEDRWGIRDELIAENKKRGFIKTS